MAIGAISARRGLRIVVAPSRAADRPTVLIAMIAFASGSHRAFNFRVWQNVFSRCLLLYCISSCTAAVLCMRCTALYLTRHLCGVWQVTMHKQVSWRTRYNGHTLHSCMCILACANEELQRISCPTLDMHVKLREIALGTYTQSSPRLLSSACDPCACASKAACISLLCCCACVVGQHYQVLKTTQASVLALSASTWLQTLLAEWTRRKPGMFAVRAQLAQREPWQLLSRRSSPACTVHPAVHVGQYCCRAWLSLAAPPQAVRAVRSQGCRLRCCGINSALSFRHALHQTLSAKHVRSLRRSLSSC